MDEKRNPLVGDHFPAGGERRVSLSPEQTTQVDVAEYGLRRLGLTDVRVGHHGDVASIDAPVSELSAIASDPLRGEVLRVVRAAGFRHVALDLGGAWSGVDPL